MRAALYARYSSDRQNERSIEDQLAMLRRRAAERGWTVVATFSDAAISGFSMAKRPGVLALLEAAEAGSFDLVLTEDEDRLARNDEHNAHIFNLLRYLGVTLATMSSDRVTKVESSIKGLLAQMTLDGISAKTRRGMASNAEQGLATGSRLYGYRTSPGGETVIAPAEAETVRRIFAGVAGGIPIRDIAAALNTDGVAGPRGGPWNASSINGSRSRANGILHTEQYIGVKVWNRMEVRKDPRTGARNPVLKPREDWKRTPVPQLRIVDQETWDRVHERLDAAGQGGDRRPPARRPHLFSGLFKCGCCGASYTVYNKDRLTCGAAREKGPAVCGNRRLVKRQDIERRVLEGLRGRLLAPEAVAAFVRYYHEAWAREAAQARDERAPLARKYAELTRRIERTLDMVEQGMATRATMERLAGIEAERDQLAEQLAAIEAKVAERPIVRLHPNAADRYADLVRRIQAHMADGQLDAEAVDAVRALVVRIDITPESAAPGAPVRVTLVGDLARFMSPEAGATVSSQASGGGRVGMVAGASYRQNPTLSWPIAC
jgi:site-specific DNA recombinase